MSLFSSKDSSAPVSTGPNNQKNNPANLTASSPLVPFTKDMVRNAVPNHLRHSISDELVDKLNNINSDPLIAENIRDNFISYAGVMREGKFKTNDYINAVSYVSHKLMGYNNEESYFRTFPQRHQVLVARGAARKDIAAYVSAYHRGKLVNLIMEQSLTPSWVLNQDIHQKAINKLAELMATANSEKVQQEAANSLLTHLAKPKDTNFQINIGETESSGMSEMRGMLQQLAMNQKEAIESGSMKTVDIAASRIIDAEVVEED